MGTAQYVSPEILTGRTSTYASDLWAIGCILYQMITGMPPFQSQSEYLIFQKIQKLEYSFYEGFNEAARDLIKRLLVIEPTDRIGASDSEPYASIRSHEFFRGLDLDNLYQATPPSITPFVPEPNKPHPVWERHPDLIPGAANLERLMLEDDEGDEEIINALSGGTLTNPELAGVVLESSPSLALTPEQEEEHRGPE